MSRTVKVGVALGLLMALEVLLFSRTFSMFFCGDSLYYFSRRLTSLGDLGRILTSVDYLEEYRPLPFMLFSFLYYPLFHLEPWGYHFIPLIFHLANTLLAFRLARRLLGTDLGAFVAAFFFGVHSANFFITYDVTMMTEFTYVFFFLIASVAFLDYQESRSRVSLALTLGGFVLALLSKESAVTLLATAVGTAWAVSDPDGRERNIPQILRRGWPLLAAGLVYFAYLLFIKNWNLFPQRPGHPHHAAFALSTVAAKAKYLQWTFNIPDDLIPKLVALPRLIIAAGLAPFVALLAGRVLWGIATGNRLVLCALLWSAATISPVLFLPNLTMVHYLYLPIFGIALIFGSIAESAFRLRFFTGGFRPAVPAFLLVVWGVSNVAACSTLTTRNLADSWVSNGSRIAQQSLADLRSTRPRLQPGTTLFFLKSNEKDLPWFFDTGGMFQVFYGEPSVRSLFADRGARLPPDYLQNDRVLVLRFIRPHLYDMTEEYKSAAQETSIRLIPAFREANIGFDKREGCYPSYTVFDTPTSKPAFVTPIGRGSIGRDAIVLIAGARLRLPLPPLNAGDRLAFSITIPFDRGDGAEAKMYFESAGQKEPLYTRSLNPAGAPNDRRWFDEAVEIGKYAGRNGSLVLECNSGPDLDVVGDWIAWSNLRVLPAAVK
jgi:hypothetical protein